MVKKRRKSSTRTKTRTVYRTRSAPRRRRSSRSYGGSTEAIAQLCGMAGLYLTHKAPINAYIKAKKDASKSWNAWLTETVTSPDSKARSAFNTNFYTSYELTRIGVGYVGGYAVGKLVGNLAPKMVTKPLGKIAGKAKKAIN